MTVSLCRSLVVLLAGMVSAAAAGAQPLPVRRYTTGDGLAHDHVNRIVQDSHGFLWFCTPRGLSRFDGYGFTTFTADHGLPSGAVNHVLQTAADEYWVATEAGVCRFAAATSRCEPYPFGADSRDKRATLMYRDRSGGLWAGTVGDVFKLDPAAGRFARIAFGPAQNRNVRAIAEDAVGGKWFAMVNAVWHLPPHGGRRRRTFGAANEDDGATSLLAAADGRLWVGHRTGLIVVNPPETLDVLRLNDVPADATIPLPDRAGSSIRLRAFDGLSLGAARTLHQADDGSIWIGLAEGGVVRFHDGRLNRVAAPRGLDAFDVATFAGDRAGNLWAGTVADGAIKMARPRFVTYDDAHGLPPAPIVSIFADRDGAPVAVTGEGQLARFDGRRFTAVRPNLPDFVSRITQLGPVALQDRSGTWWFRTPSELFRFTVPRFEALADAPPSWRASTIAGIKYALFSQMRIFEDSRGDVWVGGATQSGPSLARWDHASGTFMRLELPPEVRRPPVFFAEDREGNVWLGLALGGVARCGPKACEVIQGTLQDIPINGFYVDDGGRLWIAADHAGLVRVDAPGARQPILTTVAHTFSGRIVRSVTGDRWGRLYVGTESGIERLDPATGRVKQFTTADGLAADEQQVAFRDRHGTLWFGTVRGVSSYTPPPEEAAAPPPVHISDVRIAGAPQPVSAVGAGMVTGVELAPDSNQLQVDFASVAAAGDVLRYQYRLAGLDAEWSPPRPERSVTYARLPPGHYRFVVRAVNAEGLTSPNPATVDFRVLAPFWRQGWFLVSVVGLLGVAAGGGYRYRMRRLIELERVRTRIASDLHDDIGSTLSQIAILGEVARARANGGETANELARISALSRQSVDAMSDIVWAIDPHKDRMENLAQRIRRHASEVLPPLGIDFIFDVADEHLALGADVRREVFLAFKEALNNAVRHAQCRSISIALRTQGAALVLAVSDDGRGFEANGVTHGHGLASLARRATSLGGSLDITTNAGTTVTFQIPHRGRRTHLNR